MGAPKYPDVTVEGLGNLSRTAMTYRVAGALRRAGVSEDECNAFASEALASETPLNVAKKWVKVK